MFFDQSTALKNRRLENIVCCIMYSREIVYYKYIIMFKGPKTIGTQQPTFQKKLLENSICCYILINTIIMYITKIKINFLHIYTYVLQYTLKNL